MLSAITAEHCPPSAWNRVRDHAEYASELIKHAVLSYSLLATGDQWDFEGPAGKVSVTVKPMMRTNSGDTCIAAARKNKGVILQPSFMVSVDLLSGALVELMPTYHSIEFGIFAVYPTRQHVSPKVRALMDFLSTALKDVSWCDETSG
jgi:DNA-binding transcriptional LysR family regulator